MLQDVLRSSALVALAVACALSSIGCGDGAEPRSEGRTSRRAAAPESSSIGPQALVELFIAEVGRQDPSVRVTTIEGMRVEGRRGSEVIAEMNLENAWGECRPAPEHCPLVVERFARVFLQDEPPPLRVENLRLVLFGRDVMRRQHYAALAWAQPFAGDLMSAFVLDTPDAIATLRPESLEELGLPGPELRQRALANMREAFGPLRHEAFTPDGTVYMIQTNGNGVASDSYNAARLLLPELWRPLRELVRGELVAAAPARDVAMFTGTEEPGGVEALTYLAREMYHGEPHPVSPQLVRWSERGWVALPLSPEGTGE